jgi:hypothetical protein
MSKLKDIWSVLTHKHRCVLTFNHPFSIVISHVFMDGQDITEFYRTANKLDGAVKIEGQHVHRDDSNQEDKAA